MWLICATYPEYLYGLLLSLNIPYGAACFSASYKVPHNQVGLLLEGGASLDLSEGSTGSIGPTGSIGSSGVSCSSLWMSPRGASGTGIFATRGASYSSMSVSMWDSRSAQGWILIKGYVFANLDLSLTRNIYTIGLRCLTETDKHALLPRGLCLRPSFLWHMDVYRTAKYPQVTNFRFLTGEDLLSDLIFQDSMRTSIMNVDWYTGSFFPWRSR